MAAELNIPLTVTRRLQEADGCQSVWFERPRGLSYAAGQWLDLRFPDEPASTARTFSFASSPTEPDLMISFRNGITDYKHRLEAVSPGEQMIITQYGGGLRLNPRRPALLLAGGIGVAVFRGMIREAMDTRVNTSLALVCLNGADEFIYREELEQWREPFPALATSYYSTKTQGRLNGKVFAELAPDLTERDVFIAGPPDMVARTTALARELGADARSIQTDIFTGY